MEETTPPTAQPENETSQSPSPPNPPDPRPEPKLATLSQMVDYLRPFKDELANTEYASPDCLSGISEHIEALILQSGLGATYGEIVFIFQDQQSISYSTRDRFYQSLTTPPERRIETRLFMILNSLGGQIEPAYMISKSAQEYREFNVAIPRQAKSAATLIALGAHIIHMPLASELGPIDPQINQMTKENSDKFMPALSVKDSIATLASIAENYPGASNMLATFLNDSIELTMVGYTQRIAESAVDYASRLLSNKEDVLPSPYKDIARALVYEFKDHNFVINRDEALSWLGSGVVQTDTHECLLVDSIYKFISDLKFALWLLTKKSWDVNIVGGVDSIWIHSKNA
jgi:hypothetical protein